MALSVNAATFFSCPETISLTKHHTFLSNAYYNLSHFDFLLLGEIISEWESSPLLHDCFKKWLPYNSRVLSSLNNSLNVLSFNVRGLNLRYQEVLLLSNSFNFDILILLETVFFLSQPLSGSLV